MRRKLSVKSLAGGLLILMLLLSMNVTSSLAAQSPQKATVTATSANIHEKPSPKAKVVGSWKKGTVISVYASKAGGWSEVHYNNKVAYIPASKITLTKPANGSSATVKSTTLVVRATPSPNGEKLGSLKKGNSIVVYASKPGGWSEVHYKNQVGYVATSGLKLGTIKVNFTMDKNGIIRANYDAGDTIRLKVGQRLAVNRLDKLNRNDYHDRIMTSYGPVDVTNDGDIIGREPGASELTIIPFSYNWEDAYVIYIEVYK